MFLLSKLSWPFWGSGIEWVQSTLPVLIESEINLIILENHVIHIFWHPCWISEPGSSNGKSGNIRLAVLYVTNVLRSESWMATYSYIDNWWIGIYYKYSIPVSYWYASPFPRVIGPPLLTLVKFNPKMDKLSHVESVMKLLIHSQMSTIAPVDK